MLAAGHKLISSEVNAIQLLSGLESRPECTVTKFEDELKLGERQQCWKKKSPYRDLNELSRFGQQE